MSEENLNRWKQSGEAEKWVNDHADGWNHDDWLGLLASLKETDYWPLEEVAIREVIESIPKNLKCVEDSCQGRGAMECEELLSLASAQLYRRNLFRILGLSVTATAADVRRQQKRQQMQRKLGISSDQGNGHLLAVNPPPVDDEIHAAMDRMNEPQARLLDEVFWFWPHPESGFQDPVLKALEQGQIDQAGSLLEKQSQEDQLASHNLAVLEHLQVLDEEIKLKDGEAEKGLEESLDKRWSRLFNHWKRVCSGEEFWALVKGRVRDLDDVRLTTGLVRRIKKTLPKALLLINARMACDAAAKGDSSEVQRYLDQMRNGPWGSEVVDEALLEAVRPTRDHIKAMIDHAKSRWTHDPVHGNRYVRELHGQATSQLAVLDHMLTDGHSVRIGLHEMVADAMLIGQITFGNKTNDWPESIELMDLALGLEIGESVRSDLEDNKKVLEENEENANDWCSPGYWDLPAEIIQQLESIRETAGGGDFDSAIKSLVVLDATIGPPLKRCLAHCLSIKGIRLFNESLSEYDTETAVLKTIMDKLRYMSETDLHMALLRRPTPETPDYMMPACLSCGNTYYTSWVNFTFKDIQLFMCSSCSSKHDRQIEQQKSKLRRSISSALEYLLLAREVDPHDPGIKRNLKVVKETAREFNCSIPKTRDLKERLGAEKYREYRLKIEAVPEDQVCFFCREKPADPGCQLEVPMCGDKKPVDLIFQQGWEYHYADMIVPRCETCCEEHRQYPERVQQWEQTRLEAADDHLFPELLAQISAAQNEHTERQSLVRKLQEKLSSAKAAVESISECEKCGAKKMWKGLVCRQCHAKAFYPTYYKRALAVAVICFVYADILLWNSAILDIVDIDPTNLRTILAGFPAGALYFTLKWPQWRRRRKILVLENEARDKRKEEKAAEVEEEIESASRVEQTAANVVREARQKLQHAKQKAFVEFERRNAQPSLSGNIRPEGDYTQFCRIREFQEKGWKFGRTPDEGKDSPVEVRGLAERLVSPGQAEPGEAGHFPSKGRKRILELVRQAGGNTVIECPVCKTAIKAKNLVRHYDKLHKGVEV